MKPDPGIAPLSDRLVMVLRVTAHGLTFLSLAAGLVLLTKHTHLGGPGDQLAYYAQAARILPFTHNYFGPGYFVALRIVHDLLSVEWFTAGKILSWLSTCGLIYLCHVLFRRLLDAPLNWLALGLVTANPTLINCSYSSLTYAYGAVWVVGAIVLTIIAEGKAHPLWLLCGMVFGMACLARFQALGFFLGAVAGLLLINGISIASRIRRLAAVLAGFAIPVVSWYLFLRWSQGFIPANYNFVHLTRAFGKFNSFSEVPGLISQYGSMLGVLRTPGAIATIGTFAMKEALKFPFTVGFYLLFIAAGWLVPGLLTILVRKDSRAPWLFASLIGIVLTGIGSRGWLEYYLPALPFTILILCSGVHALMGGGKTTLAAVQTTVLLVSTALWSPIMVRDHFLSTDWPEWSVARQYLQTHAGPTDLVSSTAASLPYGTTFKFVDRDEIINPGQEGEWLDRLRARGVTYLVLSERHGYEEFPALKYLLSDDLPTLPRGLARVMLLTTPKRLAIYHISSP